MNKDKFNDIQKKIDKFKNNKPITSKIGNNSMAFNIAIELVAGVIVGLIVGLFFDNLFDSNPIFLIICIILAMIASFRSIWKKNIK